MKSLFLCFVALFFCLTAIAQPPQAFNYQGIARDGSGTPLAERNISLRLSILQGALPGTAVYEEIHYVLTNKFGVFSIEVGHGNGQLGLLEDVDWGSDQHYIKIEMDPEGGTNFMLLGESQLLSVPYALYAGNGTSGESLWQENSKGIHYTEGNIGIGTDKPAHQLSILGNNPNDDGRVYLDIHNESNSNRSWAALRMSSGNSGSYTYLNHHAASYDYEGDKFTDFGQLESSGRGVIIRASRNDGIIKFLAGGNPLSPAERMRISSNGFVGIGTENPQQKLTIEGENNDGSEIDYLFLNNTSRGNRSGVLMALSAGDHASQTTIGHHGENYDFDGNKYTDFGQVHSNGAGLILRASSNEGIIKFMNGDNGIGSSTERMRISTNGYIGIGTEAPTNLLTIDGNVDTGDERFFMAVNNNSLSNRSFSAMKFTAGAGSTMTTFGHNSETYDVNNFITADFGGIFSSGAGIHLTAGSEKGVIKFLTGIDQNGFSFERMRLTTDGKLGLGTETPAARLQIADGDVYIQDVNNGVIM
ncbi:MAG TPA: hypothetical protein VGK46_07890, partial [Saprospiraceae bacterium]